MTLHEQTSSSVVGDYLRENGMRLFVQVIIFLFAVLAAYYAIKQDIALLNQKVEAIDLTRQEDRKYISSQIKDLSEKVDKNTDRVIDFITNKK